MTLTEEQTRKLTALQNRSTRYEAIAERADGTKVRLGYLGRHSAAGLVAALNEHTWDAFMFLGETSEAQVVLVKADKRVNVIGFGCFRFSGRTQRDAIMEGELDYLPDVMKARA